MGEVGIAGFILPKSGLISYKIGMININLIGPFTYKIPKIKSTTNMILSLF